MTLTTSMEYIYQSIPPSEYIISDVRKKEEKKTDFIYFFFWTLGFDFNCISQKPIFTNEVRTLTNKSNFNVSFSIFLLSIFRPKERIKVLLGVLVMALALCLIAMVMLVVFLKYIKWNGSNYSLYLLSLFEYLFFFRHTNIIKQH